MATAAEHTDVRVTRSGFIGGGFMAQVHARAARAAEGVVAAVAGSSPEGSRLAAERLNAVSAAADVDDLLGDPDVDVVHVCTPNATHAALVRKALAAGKHVVCEKPLATSLADARALEEAADRAGAVAAIPFVYRYHPMVREARARVASGELGALLTLDGAYLQDWMLQAGDTDWRATAEDGGPSRAFADIGSHLCDLLEFVAGSRIARLTARTRRVYDRRGGVPVGNEDSVAILVEMESGAIGTLLVSQMAAGRKNALTLELHGAQASLRFDQERPEELWIGGRERSLHLLRDPRTATAAARVPALPAGHGMGFQDAFNAFVADVYAAVRGERPDGLPTFADGVRAAELTEAVLRAAREQRWIDVAAGTGRPRREESDDD